MQTLTTTTTLACYATHWQLCASLEIARGRPNGPHCRYVSVRVLSPTLVGFIFTRWLFTRSYIPHTQQRHGLNLRGALLNVTGTKERNHVDMDKGQDGTGKGTPTPIYLWILDVVFADHLASLISRDATNSSHENTVRLYDGSNRGKIDRSFGPRFLDYYLSRAAL